MKFLNIFLFLVLAFLKSALPKKSNSGINYSKKLAKETSPTSSSPNFKTPNQNSQ